MQNLLFQPTSILQGTACRGKFSRKLQAFKDGFFPDLEIQVRPCALTLQQAIEFNLPTTPLKPEESRAAQWREKFGREQTEIDALASLRPQVLRDIARTAAAPYFDYGLKARVHQYQSAYLATVNELIQEGLEARAEDLGGIRAQIGAINARLPKIPKDVDEEAQRVKDDGETILVEVREAAEAALPAIELPKCLVEGDAAADEPLFDSLGDWAQQTEKLLARKL